MVKDCVETSLERLSSELYKTVRDTTLGLFPRVGETAIEEFENLLNPSLLSYVAPDAQEPGGMESLRHRQDLCRQLYMEARERMRQSEIIDSSSAFTG